jgi:hypothetical protein
MIVFQVKTILQFDLLSLSRTRSITIQVQGDRDTGGEAKRWSRDLMKKFGKCIMYPVCTGAE